MQDNTSNINIQSTDILIPPSVLKKEFPLDNSHQQQIIGHRQAVQSILDGRDHRLMAIVGPCSIHDTRSALEYARHLKELSLQVEDSLLIVMRVYFEKPRTTVGWKGLINDPYLDGSFQIREGLQRGRELLIELTKLGLPLGTEALDPILPQYVQDLITWSAIGARTTESQTHREMASGLSGPVGFKNGTDGGLDVAINAMQSAARPHSFLGINQEGQVSIIKTKGNPFGHLILRGGGGRSNFDHVSVLECEKQLALKDLKQNIIIDCSHDNSQKDHLKQPLVLEDITAQILTGNTSIKGFMLESHLKSGNQKLVAQQELDYGVSITDKCMDWASTEECLLKLHRKLREVLPKR